MIWAEKKPQRYKRTLSDGDKKCPYCKAQWNWSLDRRVDYYRERHLKIECSKCHKSFVWDGGRI